MTIKDIFVYADDTKASASRYDVAAMIAAEHGASLIAVHVAVPPMVPFDLAGGIPVELIQWQEDYQRQQADAAAKAVAAARQRNGIKIELRQFRGDVAVVTRAQTMAADLIVCTQVGVEKGEPVSAEMLPESLALGSGRPVLAVPRRGKFRSVGKRVIIAWKATREGTRAVHDALPLLQHADWVTVLEVNPPRDRWLPEVTAAEMAAHLVRHGVKAEPAAVRGKDIDAGELILTRAAEHEADLIVAGAYGHSRLREYALGGVTKTLLRDAKVPVLLSH